MTRSIGDLVTKDPQSVEPYVVDWTAWLLELGVGVTIVTSTWAVTPAEFQPGTPAEPLAGTLTLFNPSIVTGALKTQIWYRDGIEDVQYRVTNHIITSTGAEMDGSFYVWMEAA